VSSASVKPALALALLLLVATPVRAGSGLDLVMLVDRSTSMARNPRLASLLLRMTLDLVAQNARANRVDHQLAVVTFGAAPRIDLPFTSIRAEELPRLRRFADGLPAEDRGDTDVLAAFMATEKLFRELPADPSRRRAVVLLTDGVPYVRGVAMPAYRAALQRLVHEQFSRANISIEVLLLASGREAADRPLLRDIAGNVEVVSREPDLLLARAHGVLAQLAGTRTVASAPAKGEAAIDTLVVAPYLDLIVLDVFRGSPDAEVAIFPPGKTTPVRGGVDGAESFALGDVMATLVVPHPSPGQWLIRKSSAGARVRILSQQFFPRGLLVRPPAADALRQYDRVAIAYRVIDGSGLPLAELRDYQLSLEVTLVKPNGVSTVVPMTGDAGSKSVFRSMQEAECELAGHYWTDVRITTVDDDGRRLDVFRDRWSGFSVVPASRVDCRVSASGTTAWLPMTTRIECVEAGDRPIEMSALANGSPADLFHAVLTREGRSTVAMLQLRYDGAGAFAGSLRGADRDGAYQLRLAIDRARLRGPYNIRFVPPQLSFVRRTRIECIAAALLACAIAAAMVFRRRATKS